jgi:hypothetical protein
MRRSSIRLAFLAAVASLSLSQTAQAADRGWSVLGGETLGNNAAALEARIGWPGLTIGALTGLSDDLDLGVRFSVNYGYEGLVDSSVPGIKLQMVVRGQLLQRRRLSLGLYFAPGPFAYFLRFPYRIPYAPFVARPFNVTMPGIALPVGLAFGLPVNERFKLSIAFELPMFVTFGTFGGFTLPITLGPGMEIFLDREVALTFHFKLGPAIDTRPTFLNRIEMVLDAALGVAYRF